MTKNRIIVFGGTGFIGKSFSDLLSKKKIEYKSIGSKKINFLKNDSLEKSLNILKNQDCIFFSSAVAPCKDLDMYQKNFTIFMNFLKIITKFVNYSKIIYISSDAVFSDSKNKITENSNTSPENFHGLMHIQREILLKNIVPKKKLCILRPTLVFGNEDPHNGYGPNQFFRLSKSKKDIYLFGKGEEKRDHIFINDLVKIIYNCYRTDFYGELNVVTGKLYTFNEIANYFGKKYQVDIKFLKRKGPMPHGGYRAFNNNKLKRLFPNFKYTNLNNYFSNLS